MIDRNPSLAKFAAAFRCAAAVLLLFSAQHALAQAIDPRYGAFVILDNLGHHEFSGQTSASGSLSTGGGLVLTESAASFSGSPALVGYSTSVPGRGVDTRALLFDQLTFAVASQGTAQVQVQMAGQWRGAGPGMVQYFLNLDDQYFTQRMAATGFLDSTSNTPVLPSTFANTFNGDYAGAAGTYIVNALWSVTDGSVRSISARVDSQASDGGHYYIDDPIVIRLPPGVTFTAASNSPYTSVQVSPVPEPSTWMLLAGGAFALAWKRRHMGRAYAA